MKKFDIHNSQNDSAETYLGTVELFSSEEGFVALLILQTLWSEFMDEEYDSDSQFIQFVVEKRPDLFREVLGNYQCIVF